MKFSVYQASSQGGRDDNEDRLAYTHSPEGVLLVLADGMGGYSGGERAAEIAVRVYAQSFLAQAKPRLANPAVFLQQSLLQANRAIVDYARSNDLPEQPRTTLVAAVLQDNQLWAVHAGDSRLYGLRAGQVWFRTRDHSHHDKPELFAHLPHRPHLPNRNLLFTCLGSSTPPLFDHTGPMTLRAGDQLLLCSDGLWSPLGDDAIAAGLQGRSLSDGVPDLVRLALLKAGPHSDNVSLLALEWGTAGAAEADPATAHDAPPEPDADAPSSRDEGSDVFDLGRIERSIDEIHAAIRRTAVRRNRP